MVKEKNEMENYFQFLGKNWKTIVANNGSVNLSEREAQELIWQKFLLENSKEIVKPKPNPKPKSIVKQVGSFVLKNPYLDQGGHIKVDNESKQGGDQSNKEVLEINSLEGGHKPIEVVKDSEQVREEIPHVGDDSEHLIEESTHVGEESTQMGQKHVGEGSAHMGGESTQVGEGSAHMGRESTHVGNESAHVGEERAHIGEESTHVGEENLQVGEESQQVADRNMSDECTSDSEHTPVIVKGYISPVRRHSFRPKFIPPKSSSKAPLKPKFHNKQYKKPSSKFAPKQFPFCIKLMGNVSPPKQIVSNDEPAVLVPIERSITVQTDSDTEVPPGTESVSPTETLPAPETTSDTEVQPDTESTSDTEIPFDPETTFGVGFSHVIKTPTVNEAQLTLDTKPLPSEATLQATETLALGEEDAPDTQTTTEEVQHDNIETRTKQSQQYKCKKCQKQYYQLKSFQSHVCLKNYVKMQCPSCAKMISKSNISHHMKTHSTTKHACDKCKKVFKEKTLLEKHMHKHVTAKKSICELCGKIFVRPNHLRKHMKSHAQERDQSGLSDIPGPAMESAGQGFKCKVCELEFSSTSKLKVHLKKSHVSEAKKCVKCQKVFFSSRGLRSHMKTHSIGQPLDSEQYEVVMENVFLKDIVIENIGNMENVVSDGIFLLKDMNISVSDTDHFAINM